MPSHNRADVVDCALRHLDAHGLEGFTMRRLAASLNVQASAIYHHFPNKQTLLAAVADEILLRGRTVRRADSADWAARTREVCTELRHAMLAVTDGADVVATVWAFGLGAGAPAEEIEEILRGAGASDRLAAVASRALLHYVFGHAFEEQTATQAIRVGAVERATESLPDFALGLGLVLDGLYTRMSGSVSEHAR